jgi:hypothetical protein
VEVLASLAPLLALGFPSLADFQRAVIKVLAALLSQRFSRCTDLHKLLFARTVHLPSALLAKDRPGLSRQYSFCACSHYDTL